MYIHTLHVHKQFPFGGPGALLFGVESPKPESPKGNQLLFEGLGFGFGLSGFGLLGFRRSRVWSQVLTIVIVIVIVMVIVTIIVPALCLTIIPPEVRSCLV